MDTQENKNAEVETKEQLKAFEGEIKTAFKEGNFGDVKMLAEKIRGLEPESRLATKMLAKVEKIKAKEAEKQLAEKEKEYETMLKQLFKESDAEKLQALATEYMAFAPDSRSAKKWISKAEKLKAKPEEKPGLFAKLFKKTSQNDAAETSSVAVVQILPPAPKSEEPKGNLFTKVFNKSSDGLSKKSIIDTIVAKTDQKEEVTAEQKTKDEINPAEKQDSLKLLSFSKIFMNFAIIFIALSAAFLYVEWIDKSSTILSVVGVQQNTGSRLRAAAEELENLKKEESVMNKDIELYKGGYDDQALKSVDSIIAQRINWPQIFAKINEVTNSVYELNDFFKYVEYNNYSFDAENGSIRVSGTLSDPLGRNLTKLVELEEAFKYYPKDKNDPEDTTKPYFTGFREFTAFSKTLDQATGRYTSSFQLSFSLNE